MKILYLITKSNYGGAQKYVFELAQEAKKAEHDVMVACGGTGGAGAATGLLSEKLQQSDIETIFVRNFIRDISILSDVLACHEVYRILRKERPDVLHISSSKAGGIGALAGRIAKVPNIIFTVHGLPEEESWRPLWQRRLISFLTSLTIRLSHSVITITSSDTTILQKKLPSTAHKIHYIPNAVPNFIPLSKTEARKELIPLVSTKADIIGGVGELHTNKNWSLLLHVAAALPNHVHVVIIGDGEERTALESLASKLDICERVHFLGHIPNAHLYLQLFDVFTLVSLKEGLPYVLLEAGHASLPIVASNLPGIMDIITTGEDGLLVTPEATPFTAAVAMLLRDKGMQQRLGQSLHQTVISRFSQAQMIEKTFLLYDGSIIPISEAEEEA